MTGRRVVAVTMRLAPATTYDEPRDALSHDLSRLLFALDVVPVLVPNTAPDPAALLDEVGASALLLSGGDDLGTEPRDSVERVLVAAALERRLPILGICRGLQLLNVVLGGGVTADLAQSADETHVAVTHEVLLADGTTATVNSFHRAGVVTAQLAPSLHIVAVTRGGVVEAFDDPQRSISAVQWHPERPGSPASLDRSILDGWLGRCA